MRDALFRLLFKMVRALRPKSSNSQSSQTILVLQYAMPLGCCVHGTPIFAAIKRADPKATVIVASRGMGFETLRHDPHIDYLFETHDPMVSFGSLWKTARAIRSHLRARGMLPTLVMQDASNRRGMYALFALLVGLAPTVGFADAPVLYDRHFAYDPMLSLIDNNLRLAEVVHGSQVHIEPAVYFSAQELERVRGLLGEVNPGRLLLMAFVMQGSGGQPTRWHDDRFAEVIRYAQSMGRLPAFLGTMGDAAAIDRIRNLAGGPGVSLAGRTSIPELAALLSLCDLVVTVDTGTMHVGRAVDVPMVVLGPSWQRPLEWLPLGKANARILRGADRADVPPLYKLDEIEPVDVIAAIDELVRVFPPTVETTERRIAQRLSTTRS